MKIAVDISSMHSFSKTRGIGIYAQNLVKALNKYTDIEASLVETKGEKKFDLIHYPYFDLFDTTLPLIKKSPTVVTIHDCIPLLFPDHYPPGIKGEIKNKIQRYSLRSVDAVITDSLSSKRDIEKVLNINSEKIFVVPLAPPPAYKKIEDKKRLEKLKKKFGLSDVFALFIGGVNWNKNLLNMAQACIEAKIPLVLVGAAFKNKENLHHPELNAFRVFLRGFGNNPLIKILGYLEEDDLVGVTNLASLTLLPSFYEGFGLSILQSQLCGTPVITSNTSSMPEVAGEGAIFVDPNSIESIKAGIKKALKSGEREVLIKKGFENASKYSWEKTTKMTVDVYKRVSI